MSMSAPNVSGSISGISPNCDELLAVIVSSAGAPPDVIPKRLLPALKNASSQIFLLSTSDGKDPLTVLDPEKNTIGFLYFVTTRSYIDRPNNVPGLIQHLVNFINKFDPEEARLAIDRFTVIAESLSRLASGIGKPVLAIRPLVTAIQRLAPTPAHLTTLHYRFIKICLLSKHYKDALAVLDNDIEEVDPQRLSINVEDVLLYHYYGGMAYIGMKRFDRALEFFSLVISSPSQVTSAIQIEAHKKYVLVSLLEHGKLLPLPKYTTQVVLRVFKNNCGGYLEFAQAFESLNVTRVKNEFAKVADMFTKDKNLGLARQVLQALYRRNIQQLTQTYMTLSLVDIAKQVGLEGPRAAHEAEELVVQMIESGQIFATISHAHAQGGGMVSFDDDPDRYDNGLTLAELDARIQHAAAVGERVGKLDRGIGLSKEFLARSSHPSSGTTPISFGGDEADFGFEDDGRYFA